MQAIETAMPSDISASVSETLSGKTVMVGVTGSIAAVRVVDLIRDLIRRGAEVHCTMSHAAGQILHPYALEYASAHPVIAEITGRVEHVEFCGVGERQTYSWSLQLRPTPSARWPMASMTPR